MLECESRIKSIKKICSARFVHWIINCFQKHETEIAIVLCSVLWYNWVKQLFEQEKMLGGLDFVLRDWLDRSRLLIAAI